MTPVDRACEKLIIDGLRETFPEHRIVAEESAAERPDAGPCWYIDPIDGTCNFVHGLPHCSVSIALIVDGRPRVAVVYDPAKGELFAAEAGKGASLNNNRIRVSPTGTLDQSLLVTGFPYDRRDNSAFYLRYFEAFMCNAQDLRRYGSAALDLCWVAAGRFDGFFEWGLKPWDTAAGWLIVEEAGGRVSGFEGDGFDPWSDRIAATNGAIHDEVTALLVKIDGEAGYRAPDRAK